MERTCIHPGILKELSKSWGADDAIAGSVVEVVDPGSSDGGFAWISPGY
jgi:hypothetical protein